MPFTHEIVNESWKDGIGNLEDIQHITLAISDALIYSTKKGSEYGLLLHACGCHDPIS